VAERQCRPTVFPRCSDDRIDITQFQAEVFMAKDPDDQHPIGRPGVSRRGFIATLGTGAVGAAAAAAAGPVAPPQSQTLPEASGLTEVTLLVNGRRHRLLVEPRWTLLFVLRERLGLTGSKQGCERGECGVCTVLVEDVPRYACMMLALEAEGARITTIEGLMKGEELGPVQQAFVDHDAFQCGYCTPGQIVAAEGLLRTKPHPTIDEIRQGVSGNLCRCGAYAHIFKAVASAADQRK
jgi:xanthine dehydrogenase YagT iron-sulfur-binding subunit